MFCNIFKMINDLVTRCFLSHRCISQLYFSDAFKCNVQQIRGDTELNQMSFRCLWCGGGVFTSSSISGD